MYIGLVISLICHAALVAWALVTIHGAPLDNRPTVVEAVAVAIITPDEVTRLTKGDRNAKQLETEAKAAPRPDTPKKEAPKPTPKAAAEPPPPPPPEPEAKPPEPPKPDPIAEKMAALAKEPPPPEPGPTPDEQKMLEEKVKADEQRRKADEAKKKAEEIRKKQDELRKKDEERRKKLAEDAKKKQKFDADNIAALLNKQPDKGAPAAAAEKSTIPAKAKGPVAGAPEGRDNRLTASEMSLLVLAIRQGVQPCWRVLGGGQGADATAVRMRIQFNQDGTIRGEPQIMGGQSTAFFMAAAESAKRAVLQCQPYNLPADKYAAWQDVILNFDPRDMF
jgi:colicin import membrane protein